MMEINNNGTIIKVYPSDESELTTGVMTSGKVVLHFRSDQDIKLEQGAAIEFLGNTYTLIYPQETKKLWRGYFEYIATFYNSAEQLKHKLLKDPSNTARTSFVFAGSPTDFATLIARSMGREWSVGNCVATAYDKTIAFKEESCWAALGRVAEEFHTEWVVEGKSISLRKDERYKEDPLPLSYGKGNGFLSGVSQRGNADNLPISRLYVLGSSRNIDPTKYGASTLHLPKSWSGEGMRTDEAGNYIELLEGNGAEGAMELTDLYPHRVGVVSSVVVANEAKHFYDIIDTSIPEELNYNDYRIRGEKAILKFETGALAGRQFEIRQSETALSGYHHQERRFELIPSEQDGFIMPSKEWAPKAGDKYAIFGIALPQEYVTRAENELLKEAIRTLSERSLPQFTFEGEVDGIWAKRKWLEVGGKLVPGGHVLFSDPEFHPEGTVIRITSMAQKVNNPTAPSITLSTALVSGSLWNLLNRAEAQEVLSQKRDQELQRSQRQSYEQALEHIGMVERAVEGLEGFSKRIKPSVIETMGLLVGSQATQFDFVAGIGSLKSVPPTINYNPATKQVTISSSFVRHQTIGITGITNSRKPSDYRYWSLSKYESPALTEEQESYYIYARVAKEGNTGVCLLSKTPIGMEEVSGYYHLLIGTLSSIIDKDRAYNRLYGYSMISPGQMVTDKIESANGRMRIDLATGEILSDHITFRRPDTGTETTLTDYIDEIDTHSPIIKDGTWWRWDGTRYVDTGEVAKGEKGDKGDRGLQGIQGAKGEQGISGNPGKDGHSFTASLRIKGDLRNGELGHYGVYPTFLYDGNDVTNIIQENFVTRFNENTGKGWSNWDQMASYDGLDLAEKGYEGPGVDIEVKATYKGLTAVAHAFVPHVRDGAPVRENLFTAKLYTFVQNDAYGAKCTHLGNGRWRVEKVAKSQRSWFDGASFYVNPIRDTKPGRYTISFRIVETSRPIRYSDSSAFSWKGQYVGNHYIDESNSSTGRLKGFSFFWGGSVTEGNKIGDYTIIDHIKIERVEEGEDPMPTAYLPHPLDLQGEPGKEGKSAFILRLEHIDGTVIGGKVNGFIDLILRLSYGGEEILITDQVVDPEKEIKFTDTTITYNLGDGWKSADEQDLEMQALPINGKEAPKGIWVTATAKYKGMIASDTLYIPNLPDPKVLKKVESGLTNANTTLKSLKEASEKMITSDKIKWLLDAYNEGKTTAAGGLVLTKIIALSNQVDRITAYLSGYDAAGGDGKILRAGIRYEQTLAPTGKRVRRKWIDAIAWAIDARMGVGTAAKVFNAYPYNDYDATEVEFQHWMTNIRDNFNIDIDDVIADLRNYNAVLDMSADPHEESPAQWYYEMDLYEATHTDSGSENVAIRHDGTGHFGDIHFAGDRIDYIDQATGEAYLSVGNVVNESIQDVVRKNSVDRTVTLSSASGIREGNVSVAGRFTIENDNTRVFLQYDLAVGYDHDTPSERRYGGYAEMRIKNASSPNADPWIITTPAYSGLARYGTFEKAMVNMRAGEYVVEVRSIGPYTSTGYRNFTVRQVYTSALKQSFITPRGIRFYGSPQKFVDFDYSATGPGLTIGGGLSIDYIDTPGIPLAGATFDSGGGEVKALGRYKNKRDSSFASAYYDYSTQSYKVYHSIPHDKYIPLVTPFGAMGNNENWNLSVRVYEVRAYYFTIKLLTNNDNSTKNGFSYVAFQAE